MTDKITVELDIEDAKTYARLGYLGNPTAYRVQSAVKAALPPEWEKGTLARVTSRYGGRYLAEFADGLWVVGRNRASLPDQSFAPSEIIKVEPIRVLKDDEVAVKRVDTNADPALLRDFAGDLEKAPPTYPISAEIVRAYADALEAEK